MKKFILNIARKIILSIFLIAVFVLSLKTLLPIKQQISNNTVLNSKQNFKVSLQMGDKVVLMDIEEYIKGVVTAEMPASYNNEALKAQAVVVRTYTLKKMIDKKNGKNDVKHKDADICTDFNHCSAFMTLSEAKKKWGDNWEKEYYEKICKATYDTKGEILVYNNEPIAALFHSMSSGKTENSSDVWGGDVPYLKSVKSLLENENPNFKSYVEVSIKTFKEKILSVQKDAVFKGKDFIKNESHTEGGGVKYITIGGKVFTGRQIRELFTLRSNNFEATIKGEKVCFLSLGYGHGVGMSQNGANNFASAGKSYVEILKTYYTGVELTNDFSEFSQVLK